MGFEVVVAGTGAEEGVDFFFAEWAVVAVELVGVVDAYVHGTASWEECIQDCFAFGVDVAVEVVTAVVAVVPVGYRVVAEDGLVATDFGDVDFVVVAECLSDGEGFVVVADDVDDVAAGDSWAVFLGFGPTEVAEDIEFVVAAYVGVDGVEDGLIMLGEVCVASEVGEEGVAEVEV